MVTMVILKKLNFIELVKQLDSLVELLALFCSCGEEDIIGFASWGDIGFGVIFTKLMFGYSQRHRRVVVFSAE